MLNIKSIFVPPGSAAPQMNSMEAAQKNVGPSPQKPIGSKGGTSKTRLFLGVAFLFLTVIGGASAFYLSSINQDLRQQASTPTYLGEGSDCTQVSKNKNGNYCASTAPGTCLVCGQDGKGHHAPDSQCAGLPCDPNSPFNQPKCSGGASPGTNACAGTTANTCKVCEVFSPGPGQSPQAHWVDNPGGCGGLLCSSTASPTPGGPVVSCGSINFSPGAANCSNISANGCYDYKSCHAGSNYNACTPTAGTNTCTYTLSNGTKCSAPCPDSVGSLGQGGARCQCNNGQWTIGVLPPGGSCDQLCACTGNTCKDCVPTKPPRETPPPTKPPTQPPTKTPTPVPPAQCTNIKMLDAEGGAEITGDGDKNLEPGSAVKFMCAANGQVAKYEFRVILPDGTIQTAANNPALTAVGAITGDYILPAIGKFTVQCRVCTIPVCPPGAMCKLSANPVCQEYEPVVGGFVAPTGTTTSGLSCGGIAGLTCPAGYTCDMGGRSTMPDAMGTCVARPD